MRYVICALLLMLAAKPASGDILNVPGDFPTIQAAMDAAQDGDEIVLAPGRYEITTTLIEPAKPISIVIRSTDPADAAVRESTVLVRPADQPAFVLAITPSFTLRGLTLESTGDAARFLVGTYVGNSTFEAEFDRCSTTGVRALDGALFDVELDGVTNDQTIGLRVLDCTFTDSWSGLLNHDGSAMVWDTSVHGAARGIFTRGGALDARRSTFQGVRNGAAIGGSDESSIEDSHFIDNPEGVWDTFAPLLTLSGVTVQGGLAGFDDAAEIIAEDCSFSGLMSGSALQASRITARRCVFANSNASFGAVHALQGSSLIEDCEFIGNQGSSTSCIEAHLGLMGDETQQIVIRRCVFTENEPSSSQSFEGATIRFLGTGRLDRVGGSLLIEDSVFDRNRAAFGAGLYSHARGIAGEILIRRTVFSGNSAAVGAVYINVQTLGPMSRLEDGSPEVAQFEDCEFIGNSAGQNVIAHGSASFTGSSLVQNVAAELGSVGLGQITMHNSILVVPDDGTSLLGVDPNGFTPSLDIDHSIVPAGTAATDSANLDPLFMRNPSDGGDGWGDDPTTPDIDESLNDDFGDLRLRPGSPAIDAGTNDFFMPGDVDLDGNPRLADDPGIPDAGPNGTVDIGAYEFQGTSCLADVTQDGFVTPADFNAWILAYNNGSPLADQTRDGRLTPADFNAWIINFNATFAGGCP